jgi:hypothetical protein
VCLTADIILPLTPYISDLLSQQGALHCFIEFLYRIVQLFIQSTHIHSCLFSDYNLWISTSYIVIKDHGEHQEAITSLLYVPSTSDSRFRLALFNNPIDVLPLGIFLRRRLVLPNTSKRTYADPQILKARRLMCEYPT